MRNSIGSAPSRATRRVLLVTALPALLLLGLPRASRTQEPATEAPPSVPREFRGVWVAAVANIDWPSKPGLSTWEQQRELVAILDRSAALKLNAVVLHVRPAADALYASKMEPWSAYLTGQQGLAPEPSWDPLTFAVAEAHKRGLELHAWFNPYRAFHPSGRGLDTALTHISRTRSSLVRRYGTHLWMDPGDPAVRRHSVAVVLDVVKRYDVDGVHIDDYFYPYKERDASGRLIDFPDEETYAAYRRKGGALSRDDWRRHNVDDFVRDLYSGVKKAKPWVKVGISPFGIWRPGFPSDVRGFDAYQEIYADSRKWLRNGWADYFAPQLYWPPNQQGQRFESLLGWWTAENVKGRHIWPGLFTSRLITTSRDPQWTMQDILEQMRLIRANRSAGGEIHFSMKSLVPDSVALPIARRFYAEDALVPASPWLDRAPVPTPTVRFARDSATGGTRITIAPSGAKVIRWWTVQMLGDSGWTTRVLPGDTRTHVVTRHAGEVPPRAIWVRAVDRVGKESPAAVLRPHRSGSRWVANAVQAK